MPKPTGSSATPTARRGGSETASPSPAPPRAMNLPRPRRLGSLVLFLLSAARAAEPADEAARLALLHSSAPLPEKCAACVDLRQIGTPRAVPVLAGALSDPRLGHAARHALEGLPFPEAGAALRAALGRTTGALQAGLAESLGVRRDPEAVPLLVPLLAGADDTVADAAAAALGRIANAAAEAALRAARTRVTPAVRPAVWEGLLSVAERRLAEGNPAAATALYRELFTAEPPEPYRTAAWSGLARADAPARPDMVRAAWSGRDEALRTAATRLVRELRDPAVIQMGLTLWDELPESARLAVVEAHADQGAAAWPTLRRAIADAAVPVRVAAWRAVAELGDPVLLAELCRAAAQGPPAERAAAREALTRLRGPGVREVLVARLAQTSTPAEQVELLRAFGARGETVLAAAVVPHLRAADPAVAVAAAEALGQLAVPETWQSLFETAALADEESRSTAALRALTAVCRAAPAPAALPCAVVTAMAQLPAQARERVLPLLPELATAEALAAALAAARAPEPALARAALRVLADWPNPEPASHLLRLAEESRDEGMRSLALRGSVAVLGLEPDPARRLEGLLAGLEVAQQPADKIAAFGLLGQIPTREALAPALEFLGDPALVNEAALAAVSIAEKLAPTLPALGPEVAAAVLEHCRHPAVVPRAWALRGQPAPGPFLQHWRVAGPYRQAGAAGARALFDPAFDPETAGAAVRWAEVPAADVVDLAALFPGAENCAAYLRTEVLADRETEAMLLLGSDDGLKVWLNGEPVFGNNTDRGLVADQDAVLVRLRRGPNTLLLKVTQGGGGWAACARLLGLNGRPLEGCANRLPAD